MDTKAMSGKHGACARSSSGAIGQVGAGAGGSGGPGDDDAEKIKKGGRVRVFWGAGTRPLF